MAAIYPDKFLSWSSPNGIPERKDVTREVERRKREQAEADERFRQDEDVQQQRPANS